MIDGKKIIKVALGEQGYSENPPNSNNTKYGVWFSYNLVAWCGIFISWIYDKAGFPLGNIGYSKGFAGTDTMYNHAKTKGWLTDKPVIGDIILWRNTNPKPKTIFKHTSLFISKLENNLLLDIAGNTSYGDLSNGGQVLVMIKENKDCVFIHPVL